MTKQIFIQSLTVAVLTVCLYIVLNLIGHQIDTWYDLRSPKVRMPDTCEVMSDGYGRYWAECPSNVFYKTN